jgi:hypothetical protein
MSLEEATQMNEPQYGNAQVMSIGDWMVTYLIASLPLVNIIMLFVWAFSAGTNANKANWAKATLIYIVAVTVLWVLVFASMLGSIMDLAG